MIDIKSILDELDIPYKEYGKNVSPHDLNVDCPFCGWEKHLGINKSSGQVFCWVCEFADEKYRPSLLRVLVESSGFSYEEVKQIMEEHGWERFYVEDDHKIKLSRKGRLPKEAIDIDIASFLSGPRRYILKRNFSLGIVKKYGLKYCKSGPYRKRMIIPIHFDGKLVSFTSRSYSGEGRYKHANLSMSSMRIKSVLYNLDTAKQYERIFILEGPTDVWRMGDDSVCVFKSKLSRDQRNIIYDLYKKGLIREIVIVFDPMATARAYEAADMLLAFMDKVKVIRLIGDKDVADRSRNEILYLEKQFPYYVG